MDADGLTVKDIMTTSPVTLDIDETVSDAMAKIRKYRVKELPVLSKGKPVGLVSYTSFIERRNVPINAKVGAIMLPVPRLTEADSLVTAAEALVSAGIRGAPVMRNNKMVGFVSRTDIIRVVPSMRRLSKLVVRDFMTTEPQSAAPSDHVRKAQIIMEDLNEKALPVVGDGGKVVGVIGMTEVMDVLWSPRGDSPPRSPKPPRKVFDGRVRAQIQVSSVMTRNPVNVSPDDQIDRVVKLMLDKGLSTLFVTEEDRLVGVVDQSDLMEQVISLKPRDEVFVQISGMTMHEPEVLDGLYSLIGKGMRRIAKMERPRVFYLHVATYDADGLASKVSLRGRLNTDGGMYYVRNSGWDLFKAMSDQLEALETKVRRDREKALDRKKGR